MEEVENLKQSSAELAAALESKEKKSEVISLRVEPALFKAIAAQAQAWNKTPAETVRTILRFYFVEELYEAEFKEKEASLTEEHAGFNAGAYVKFLLEVMEKNTLQSKFLRSEAERVLDFVERKVSEAVREEHDLIFGAQK